MSQLTQKQCSMLGTVQQCSMLGTVQHTKIISL